MVAKLSKFLGQKIRKHRKLKKFTLFELKERVGISKSYLHGLETGNNTSPSAQILAKLACELGVTTCFLLDDKCLTMTKEQEDIAFYNAYKQLNKQQKEQMRCYQKVLLQAI